MKYGKILGLSLVSALFITACKGKSDQAAVADNTNDMGIIFNANDTIVITDLANQYADYILNGDLEAAAGMIYTYRNDSLLNLSAEDRVKITKGYSLFHIYDCRLKSIRLEGEYDNEVRIAMQIIEDGSIDEEQGVTYISLNPILYMSNWYLTIKE